MALTPNLNLHIYDKDSKPTYLMDHNNDMTSIDQGYAALKLSTDTASTNVAGITTQVNSVQQLAESASALATQANENSSHASADASAAVAAANNANTEAAKAVAATEGLVNIDDIEILLGDGWNLVTNQVSVKNGILCGMLVGTADPAQNITVTSNYNIKGRVAVGTGTLGSEAIPFALDINSSSEGKLNTAFVTFCCPWDPTWTKKTNS